MHSLISRQGRAILLGALCLISAGTALAAPNAPSKAKIAIKGSLSFKPNAYFKQSYHFVSGTVTIKSGGTVTLRNTTSDPHSLSLVKKSGVPRTAGQINNCAICGPFFGAHGISQTGPPSNPIINVGAPGFNTPGDSILVAPKGSARSTVSFKVTAKPGTTLYFICIFHPWMQGRFIVK